MELPLDRKGGTSSGYEEWNYLVIGRVELLLDRKNGTTSV
jgi:hypothetical protein